ncbi:uncharacterized protein LOC129232887 [Uloborus diversus]|uniref:uncharacterized protein LOC129232887 n=1 Tax=Uloborus diversus TaxID=327109 RepID=UPI00240A40E7|nr:uncharacterized protein LOC129232887 [Uloborus diversus]
MASKNGGRSSKFNPDVLKECDMNGDLISIWCVSGYKPDEAICTFCNVAISCKHHGSAAVKRHSKTARHVTEREKHRDKDGVLKKTTQTRINYTNSRGIECEMSHSEKVSAAEIQFVVSLADKGIPYTFSDTATMLFPQMFTDSKIAKDFTCSRTKASYLISDGLGPYFKDQLLNEIRSSGSYYSIIVDETPLPEKRLQQMDVFVRFYSNISERVIAQHLQSFHIGHGTADVMFQCVREVFDQLPNEKLLCFFSDGPNVMKSLVAKVKAQIPQILDVSTCNLHKVHNSFSKALTVFGGDVELLIVDLYYFFKHSSAKSADLKELQEQLSVADRVLVRHVSSRWLTLETSLIRFIDMFELINTFFRKGLSSKSRDGARCKLIKQALHDKSLLPKALFLRNVSDILNRFVGLFQTEAPLIHILYDEMVSLVKTLLGRFLTNSFFQNLPGTDLKVLDVSKAEYWKTASAIDIGLDTQKAMASLSDTEKKSFYLGARSFYLACTKKLLKTLPLDNRLLFHLQVLHPVMKMEETSILSIKYLASNTSIVKPEEVSLLKDEWIRIQAEPEEESSIQILTESSNSNNYIPIDVYWKKFFDKKDNLGNKKYPFVTKLFQAFLCVPHGSADIERGFSTNKKLLDNRGTLNCYSVNGLRQINSYITRIGGIEKFKVNRDIIKAARAAYKNYTTRVQKENEGEKRCRETENSVTELQEAENKIKQKLKASQELLASYLW